MPRIHIEHYGMQQNHYLKSMSKPVKPLLVRLSRKGKKIIQNCDIYIGQQWKSDGWDLKESCWHLQCKPGSLSSERKDEYYKYIKDQMSDRLEELSGKVLGCWCRDPGDPKTPYNICHGDWLIELWCEKFPEHEIKKDLHISIVALEKKPQKKKAKIIRDHVTNPQGIGGKPWPEAMPEEEKVSVWLDETGRGSWMGPMYVTATFLKEGFNLKGLHDSKTLKDYERACRYKEILDSDKIVYHTSILSLDTIDDNGIQVAWHIGVKEAVKALKQQFPEINCCYIDGNVESDLSDLGVSVITVEKGDAKYRGIAAASIIAKESRDQYMIGLGHKVQEESKKMEQEAKVLNTFSEFMISRKGYGDVNQKALVEKGYYTEYHRMSYKPMKTVANKKIISRSFKRKREKEIDCY